MMGVVSRRAEPAARAARRRTARGGDRVLLLGVVVLTATLVVPPIGPGPVRSAPTQLAVRAAAGPTVSITGAAPGAVSLGWTASTSLIFSDYTVQESVAGSGGPWSNTGVLSLPNLTSFFAGGLTPGATYWWRVLVHGPLGAVLETSNVAGGRQPDPAHLSMAVTGDAAVTLSWTNNANYTGDVRFHGYAVQEAVGNGSFSTVANVWAASNRSVGLAQLQPSTSYRFAVLTDDECSGAPNCGPLTPESASRSNTVFVITPAPLSVRISANSSTLVAGSTAQFSATASGGTAPYTYSWQFGDGATASARTVTHRFNSPGNFSVVSVVTDAYGRTARDQVGMSVQPAPSSGGGGSGSGGQPNGTPSSNGSGGNGLGTPPSSFPHRGVGPAHGAASWEVPGAVLIIAALLGGLFVLYFYSRGRAGPPRGGVGSGSADRPDPVCTSNPPPGA